MNKEQTRAIADAISLIEDLEANLVESGLSLLPRCSEDGGLGHVVTNAFPINHYEQEIGWIEVVGGNDTHEPTVQFYTSSIDTREFGERLERAVQSFREDNPDHAHDNQEEDE